MFRLIMGYADGQCLVTINSLICATDEKDRNLALTAASAGIGALVGPVVGSFIYVSAGFPVSLFFFSFLLLLIIVLAVFTLPASFNEELTNSSFLEEIDDMIPLILQTSAPRFTRRDLSLFSILSHRRQAFVFLVSFCGQFAVQFTLPFLALHLTQSFRIKDALIGYIYLMGALCCIVSVWLVPYTLSGTPRRIIQVISLAGCAASYVLASSDALWPVLTGMALLGFSQGPLNVIIMPEAIETFRIEKGYALGRDDALDRYLEDQVATLENYAFNLAMVVAPIAGGALY